MSRALDCGMSPFGSSHLNYIPVANASEPAGSVLHRRAWEDALFIGDFLANTKWQQIAVPPWDPAAVSLEIQNLENLMHLSLDELVMLTIFNEAVDFTPRFENVCLYDGHSHPRTYRMVQTVSQIGWFVVQHFKNKHKRLRPSQVDPHKIRPLIRVPSHPSYPSGHATQSLLVGLLLQHVIGLNQNAKLFQRIDEVALDIAVNRERAGVHYPSDSEAGRNLGQEIFEMFLARADVNASLGAALEEARAEWQNES